PLMFEVKELTEDENFGQGLHHLSTRQTGAHVRSKISESKKQIQIGAKHGISSVLLIYNALDSCHAFGTEAHDFRAAMHGDWTLLICSQTRQMIATVLRKKPVA